jgi:hypothetical protein
VCGEVGGGNGIEPLCIAASLGLPVVDGDLMGRAFPELHMTTAAIAGLPPAPAALADEKGNVVVARRVAGAPWLERLLRPVCTEMGGSAGFAACLLRAGDLRRVLVPHTLSLAWRLGRAVARAQHAKRDAAEAAAAEGGGRVVFRGTACSHMHPAWIELGVQAGGAGVQGCRGAGGAGVHACMHAGRQARPMHAVGLPAGKIVEVDRRTTEGFAKGRVTLEGVDAWQGRICSIVFQNENLVATIGGAVAAAVPDLITLLEESECGAGMRVSCWRSAWMHFTSHLCALPPRRRPAHRNRGR